MAHIWAKLFYMDGQLKVVGSGESTLRRRTSDSSSSINTREHGQQQPKPAFFQNIENSHAITLNAQFPTKNYEMHKKTREHGLYTSTTRKKKTSKENCF